jgi:hypothetical protein
MSSQAVARMHIEWERRRRGESEIQALHRIDKRCRVQARTPIRKHCLCSKLTSESRNCVYRVERCGGGTAISGTRAPR